MMGTAQCCPVCGASIKTVHQQSGLLRYCSDAWCGWRELVPPKLEASDFSTSSGERP